MKRFSRFVVLVLALGVGLAMSIPDAEARRMGGGSSFGMKRSIAPRQATPAQATPRPAQQAQAGAAPAKQGASRWLGPVAGLAAGLGLAALFSHLGMGEGMANVFMMLLLVGGAVMLFRFLMRKSAPQLQTAGATMNRAATTGNGMRFDASSAVAAGATSQAASTLSAIPADFDEQGFLRQAKLNFIRLQAANDAGNMEDIRSYTTPEMFAEIRLQHQERKGATQQTDVMELQAELLDVTTETAQQIASVRFFGLIREEATAEQFSEIWHLTRAQNGTTGWVIAGIEQSN